MLTIDGERRPVGMIEHRILSKRCKITPLTPARLDDIKDDKMIQSRSLRQQE